LWEPSGSSYTTSLDANTDAITLIGDSHVPRDVFESARGHFEDKELAELIWAVIVINAWNRMAVTARSLPGEYTPG
jgi:alkylhydroperoxidase family enzyme